MPDRGAAGGAQLRAHLRGSAGDHSARPSGLWGDDIPGQHLQVDAGHIPGAAGFNWQTQLQHQVRRDIISKEDFEKLAGQAGISPRDTVVLYGDNNNWFAAYGFWLFKVGAPIEKNP